MTLDSLQHFNSFASNTIKTERRVKTCTTNISEHCKYVLPNIQCLCILFIAL